MNTTNLKEKRGIFIVFEGSDGTGKSTQLSILEKELCRNNYPVIATQEPSSGTFGLTIRKFFHNRQSISAADELQLFLDDRKDHLQRTILPALDSGKIVLCDRYFLSTVAYQGAASPFSVTKLLEMNSFAPPPDIALLLYAPVSLCLQRIKENRREIPNDFEKKEHLEQVTEIFNHLDFPWLHRIDARSSKDHIAQQIAHAVQPLLDSFTKKNMPNTDFNIMCKHCIASYTVGVVMLFLLSGCASLPLSQQGVEVSHQAMVVERVLQKHREETGQSTIHHIYPSQNLYKRRRSAISQSSNRADYNCSWFYFLWGTQSEYDQRYEEAYYFYEKALACDPTSTYIEKKLPILLLQMQRYKAAEQWLHKKLKQQPNNRTYIELLAGISFQQKRHQEAVTLYKKLISLSPNDDDAVNKLAVFYMYQKRYDEAEALLKSYLATHHKAVLPRLTLARIYTVKKQFPQAIRVYKQLLAYEDSEEFSRELALVYQVNNQENQAEKIYRSLLAQNSQNEKAAYALISLLNAKKRYNDALTELNRLRLFSSQTNTIDYAKSRVLLSDNKIEQAKALLQTLTKGDMHNEAYYQLGQIAYVEKEFEKGLYYLDLVEPDSSSFPASVFVQTNIYKKLGQKKQVIQRLQNCIDDRAHDVPPFHLLLSSFLLKEGQITEAQKALITGLKRYPSNIELLYQYAMLHEQEGHREKAMQTMQKIISIEPEHANALNFIGYSWAEQNKNLEKAYQYIQKAIALKPKNGFILDSLGWVLFRMKKYGKAVTTLIHAQLLIPENALVSEHIGDVYQAIGSMKKAEKWYRDAASKAENDNDKKRVEEKLRSSTKEAIK